MITLIKKQYQHIGLKYPLVLKIFRYLVSGGTSAVVDLGLLYVFTEFFHVWYLLSAIVAFVCAVGVGFFLQKTWTFKDSSQDAATRQMTLYLIIALFNLGINTLLIYLFVHFLRFHYMAAQFVAAGLIAVMSFFLYKKFVFKSHVATH